MTTSITETLTNPTAAVTVGTVAVVSNTFIAALPVIINCVMAVYLVILVAQKIYQFRNEIKDRRARNESSK